MSSFRLDLVYSLSGLEMKELLECVLNTFNSHSNGFVDGDTKQKRSQLSKTHHLELSSQNYSNTQIEWQATQIYPESASSSTDTF